jgi:hypothetical protein
MNASRLVVIVAAIALFASVRWMAADSWSVPGTEKPFHKDLLKAAAEYEAWRTADNDMRWAPVLCSDPRPWPVAFSTSKDWSTHGQKLYSLFARNRGAYRSLRGGDSVEIGQVVVKQSWLPEEVTPQSEREAEEAGEWKVTRTTDASGTRSYALVHEDGLFYPLVCKGEKVFEGGPAGRAVRHDEAGPGNAGHRRRLGLRDAYARRQDGHLRGQGRIVHGVSQGSEERTAVRSHTSNSSAAASWAESMMKR